MILALLLPLAALAPQDSSVIWEEARLERGERRFEPMDRPLSSEEPTAPAPELRVAESWLKEGEAILHRLVHEGHRDVLLVGRKDGPGRAVLGGSLANSAPEWRHELHSLDPVPEPGAYLLSASQPHASYGGPGYLLLSGDVLFVQGGERSELKLIDLPSGKVRTSLQAPWELERGFMGPSVWSAMPCRFGDAEGKFGIDKDPEILARKRAAFEARCYGWLLGPPLLSGKSVFITMGRAAPGQWARQRASNVLLELDLGSLVPKTLTDLPGPVYRPRRSHRPGAAGGRAHGRARGCRAHGRSPRRSTWHRSARPRAGRP